MCNALLAAPTGLEELKFDSSISRAEVWVGFYRSDTATWATNMTNGEHIFENISVSDKFVNTPSPPPIYSQISLLLFWSKGLITIRQTCRSDFLENQKFLQH